MQSMNVTAYKKLKTTHTNIQFAIYLPIDPGSEHTLANATKFKSTIATLKQVFKDADISRKQERKIISELRGKASFFSSGIAGKGVCLFIYNDTSISLFSLPFSPKPAVYYNLHNLHLEPLEQYFGSTVTYWVLMLSANGCHLLKSDGRRLQQIDDAGLQLDLKTALNLDETNLTGIQTHSTHEGGNKGDGGFHGHGGFKDMRKKYMLDYFRLIDGRVKEYIANHHEPVMLVGVEHIQSLYKKATKNRLIMPTRISVDPHGFSLESLQAIIAPIVPMAAAKSNY